MFKTISKLTNKNKIKEGKVWEMLGIVGVVMLLYLAFCVKDKVEILGINMVIFSRIFVFLVVVLAFANPDGFEIWGALLFFLFFPVVMYVNYNFQKGERNAMEGY